MFHILRPPPTATLIQRTLAETDRDLLHAIAQAEYWAAIADMLARRQARLRGYLPPADAPATE